jgi:phasin
MQGISMLVSNRVQVGVGRNASSIVFPVSPTETQRQRFSRLCPNQYAILLTRLESRCRPSGGDGRLDILPWTRQLHTDRDRLHGRGPALKRAATILEGATMVEPKLEVPTELRDLAEKSIDQAEKAFSMFFDAASKSMTSMPGAGTEISKQALSFTEQNMKAAFEHARKLVHATDLQEAMRIQSEFLRSQFTNAGEHMRQITGSVVSAASDATKGKF